MEGIGFEIEPKEPQEQIVDRHGYTKWDWQIRAREPGLQPLWLKIRAGVTIEGKDRQKIEALKEEIKVLVVPKSWADQIGDLFGGPISWIIALGTLIGMLVGAYGWLRSRRSRTDADRECIKNRGRQRIRDNLGLGDHPAYHEGIIPMKKECGAGFASLTDGHFSAKYRARCYCKAVQYEVRTDPVDAKICHCRTCQRLHGAPMQWAAIFHKYDVRITKGITHLRFYNPELKKHERILPCKVSCARCGTLIADEGREMWLAFPSLFDFGGASKVPKHFKPTCHIFYSMRVIDMDDDLPKWAGHKNKSEKVNF